jgi:hypothetical protein
MAPLCPVENVGDDIQPFLKTPCRAGCKYPPHTAGEYVTIYQLTPLSFQKCMWDVYNRFVFYCFQLYISSKHLRGLRWYDLSLLSWVFGLMDISIPVTCTDFFMRLIVSRCHKLTIHRIRVMFGRLLYTRNGGSFMNMMFQKLQNLFVFIFLYVRFSRLSTFGLSSVIS